MAIYCLHNGIALAPLILSPGILIFFAVMIRRAFFSPLSHIPGPWICRITSLWTYYHAYIGDECTRIDELHKKYGAIILIAPNEVCISDGNALAPIYSDKGGFLKASCYSNFDIEGHKTIFSALDPTHRAIRSKPVLPMFSMSNVRNGNGAIDLCVRKYIDRMKEEAERSRAATKATGQPKPINLLNLSRSLALDAICSYLFGRSFGSIEENGGTMSASLFVDALVAVGRFFYLPNWLFLALEKTRLRFFQGKVEQESFCKVGSFTQQLVDDAKQDDGMYQQRLVKAGISDDEVKIQCEDLIFAGTDSTGMNLSTICWQLSKHPKM